ncbi:MAG TPA: hypothetical protein VFH56_02125 [Acidimicrobiales bacterium]|nr:hypothetical protein [Acidimicrobiales bacterium]
MQPIDNSQFTEEQRAEAYRVESMRHMERQTQALESIRGIMLFFTALFVIGVAVYVLMTLSAANGGL